MEKTKTKIMNKKGSSIDLFLIIPFLLAFSIMVIAVFMVVQKTNESGIWDNYADAQEVHNQGKNSLLTFDNMMFFIIIGLSLFVIISSALVWNHPAFLVLGLILLAIALTVAGVISNAWIDFTANATIAEYSSAYPKITFIMNYLPFYILFMGIASSIAMYIGYQRQ